MNPRRFRRIQEVLARRQPDLTVLMERVNKPHNFAAILRNCDAVGILEAHVVPPKKGIHLSNHTSAGTAKWVSVQTHSDVEAAIRAVRKAGFRVLAAHPAQDAVDFRTVDFTQPVAIMVGAELEGISAEGLAAADEKIVIPMAGMARSLNVSVATALLLFEAQRQRAQAGFYGTCRISEEEYRTRLFEWCHPELAELLKKRNRPYPPLSPEGEPILKPGALQEDKYTKS